MLSQLSNLLGLGLAKTAPDARPGQKPTDDFATLFAESEDEDRWQASQGAVVPDIDDSKASIEDAPDPDAGMDETIDGDPADTSADAENLEVGFPGVGGPPSASRDNDRAIAADITSVPAAFAGRREKDKASVARADGLLLTETLAQPLARGSDSAAGPRIGEKTAAKAMSEPAASTVVRPASTPRTLALDPSLALPSGPLAREAYQMDQDQAQAGSKPGPEAALKPPAQPLVSDLARAARVSLDQDDLLQAVPAGRAPENPPASARLASDVSKASPKTPAKGPELPIFRLMAHESSVQGTLSSRQAVPGQMRADLRTSGLAAPTATGLLAGLETPGHAVRLPGAVRASVVAQGTSLTAGAPVAPGSSTLGSQRLADIAPVSAASVGSEPDGQLRLPGHDPDRRVDIALQGRSEALRVPAPATESARTGVAIATRASEESPLKAQIGQGSMDPVGPSRPQVPIVPGRPGEMAPPVGTLDSALGAPAATELSGDEGGFRPEARSVAGNAPIVVGAAEFGRAWPNRNPSEALGPNSGSGQVTAGTDPVGGRLAEDAAQAVAPAGPAAAPQWVQQENARFDRIDRVRLARESHPDPLPPVRADGRKTAVTPALASLVPGASAVLERMQASRVTSPFLADFTDDQEVIGVSGHTGTEVRAHVPGMAVHTAGLPRTDPQPVLRQIAEGVARMREGGVDLQLAPEELGRVRMRMVSGEGGLAVHIMADRPETLDLMRRNIDQLARDLADAGYGGAEFTFGDGGGNEDRTPRGGPGIPSQEPVERAVPEHASAAPVTDGLDIRI